VPDERTKKNWQAGFGVPFGEALLQALVERVERGEPTDDLARAIAAAYHDGEFRGFKRRKLPDDAEHLRVARLVEQKIASGIDRAAAIDDVAEELSKERSVVAKYHRKYGRMASVFVMLAAIVENRNK
jgi:hypothetical protein